METNCQQEARAFLQPQGNSRQRRDQELGGARERVGLAEERSGRGARAEAPPVTREAAGRVPTAVGVARVAARARAQTAQSSPPDATCRLCSTAPCPAWTVLCSHAKPLHAGRPA